MSTSSILRFASSAFGVLFIAFGINAMVNIESALSFFELAYPAGAKERLLVDALSVVYGARDVFMGIAICAAAYFGSSKTLGLITVSAGGVAGVDGAVCKFMVGAGEWSHWGYAPMLVVLGVIVLLGQ